MLIAVIAFKNISDVIQTILRFQDRVDGFEIRWDFLEEIRSEDVQLIRRLCRVSLIFTLRRMDQGGQYHDSEFERYHEWLILCSGQPDFIDLEWDVPISWIKNIRQSFPNIKIIGSYHDFSGTLDAPSIQFHSLFDVIKVATFCHSSLDALKLLHWQQQEKRPSIFIGMGESSQFLRPLGPIFGRYFDYAATSQDAAVVPGQLTVDELLNTYCYRDLNRNTRIYALIGSPIESSLGHQYHNWMFSEKAINAVYVKINLNIFELEAFFPSIVDLPFDGFSVTMPLKKAVRTYVEDRMSDVGALNTLKREDGCWIGINTDGEGAIQALGDSFSKVFILGAGGAGCALAHAFLKRGRDVCIWNRTPYSNFKCTILNEFPEYQDYDLLINTLPDKVYQENPDLLEKISLWVKPGMTVMDINYQNSTQFLKMVKYRQLNMVSGLQMFIEQAKLQQSFWL